ncbi:protein NRT1/ PTR FAMILY 4.6-like [Henckelia pumila]|uniref:protein NRT1/ PTR FAMILY 4.6-like n=1 Tax=Henckelia pumila TaxID=405737 RepID=UPI003C6E2CAE
MLRNLGPKLKPSRPIRDWSYTGSCSLRLCDIFGCLLVFQGLGLLALQAHYPKLMPPLYNIYDKNSHCVQVSGTKVVLLFVGLYSAVIGFGGIKAGLPSHGADQFKYKDPKEKGQRSSFFSWLLLARCLGGAISLTVFVWIQDNKGWDWGFFTSTMAMFCGLLIFASRIPWYRIHVTNGRSSLSEIVQVNIVVRPRF